MLNRNTKLNSNDVCRGGGHNGDGGGSAFASRTMTSFSCLGLYHNLEGDFKGFYTEWQTAWHIAMFLRGDGTA